MAELRVAGFVEDASAAIERAELQLAVDQLVQRLPPRMRQWLCDCYGWYGRPPMTGDPIGPRAGCPRERVRQVLNRARETLAMWIAGSACPEARRLRGLMGAA